MSEKQQEIVELDEETIKKLDVLRQKALDHTKKAQKQIYGIVEILRKKDAIIKNELYMLYNFECLIDDICHLAEEGIKFDVPEEEIDLPEKVEPIKG